MIEDPQKTEVKLPQSTANGVFREQKLLNRSLQNFACRRVISHACQFW